MDLDDFFEAEKQTAKTKWRKNPVFLKIKGVTKKDLQNGSDYIEKLKSPPWNQQERVKKEDSIGFGKYATLTYEELEEKDPRYFAWAMENVKGFKEKSEKFLK